VPSWQLYQNVKSCRRSLYKRIWSFGHANSLINIWSAGLGKKALGVTRPALSALINQRASLSSEMALRIEKAFGVSKDTLMRMQNSYDIAKARLREHEIIVGRYEGVGASL
jgi:addiction module HigA family antidote